VDAAAARPGTRAGAGLLAGHRDRAAPSRGLGGDRPAQAGDPLRPSAPDRLRPAHRRRPARLRGPRGAVPPRLAGAAGVRPRAAGVRAAVELAARALPRPARPCGHPRLGRAARDPARLVGH
jgi:hypothetical protein